MVFAVSAAVTSLLATLSRVVAERVGAVATVRDRDVHATPVPYLGGLAMLGGLWAGYLVATRLPFLSTADTLPDARSVLVGGTLVCAVGVFDDVFELDALAKFGGQVLGAAVVVLSGVSFLYLPLPGGGTFGLNPTQAQLLTVLVIVATVNAVNFVDGLDGLAAGVVTIGAVAFFLFAYLVAAENNLTRAIAAALLMAALAGACCGFLPHNFYPARMFMGDSGSMLIGLVLACGAVTLSGQFPPGDITEGLFGATAGAQPVLLPLLLPVAMLLVPFLDLALAVTRRTRAGRSPFSPDKLHLHHRLLEIGHSHRRAVLLVYAVAGLVAFGTVVVSLFGGWRLVTAISLLAVVTAVAVFWLPRVHRSLT